MAYLLVRTYYNGFPNDSKSTLLYMPVASRTVSEWKLTLPKNLSSRRAALPDKRISKVVQAPGFIRGINPKLKIENPQAPAFIRGVNLKSKI